jgi:hypothetical protein
MRLVIVLLSLSACRFEPAISDGRIQCSSDRLCPPGLACAADNRCWRNPAALDFAAATEADGNVVEDLRMVVGDDLSVPDLSEADQAESDLAEVAHDFGGVDQRLADFAVAAPDDLKKSDLAMPICGAAGQPCCAAATCSFGGCCVSGSCIASGAAPSGMPTTICSNGAVVSCGAAGAPCCASNGCGTGCCYSGVCVAANAFCAPTLKCAANGSGSCGTCGASGSSSCCAGSPSNGGAANFCTAGGTGCDPANKCATCGVAPQPCCDSNQCGTGCCDHALGHCVAPGAACNDGSTCTTHGCSGGGCGRAGLAPCGGGIGCTDAFTVAQANLCVPCGGLGQACCDGLSGKSCSPPYACNNGTGSCGVCGGNGEPCCPGSLCAGSTNHTCGTNGLCT